MRAARAGIKHRRGEAHEPRNEEKSAETPARVNVFPGIVSDTAKPGQERERERARVADTGKDEERERGRETQTLVILS